MTCEEVQEFILEAAPANEEVSAHLAQCDSCRSFFALQQSLDEKLARAYAAPSVSRAFRERLRANIRAEKSRCLWDVTGALIPPAVGLAMSGVCALLLPDIAGLALAAGLGLSGTSYVGQLLFTWLTEELGEG